MLLPEIFKKWPPQTVATSKWLNTQGVSRQLTAKYCTSGWLEKITHGCYKRADDKIDWKGAVYALQTQLGLNIAPSAYTALYLQGYHHHLNAREQNIYLLGSPRTTLPRWFIKGDWQVTVHYKTSSLFLPQAALCTYDVGGNFAIQICSPERAILEVLDEVNNEPSFEDASNLMSGLLDLKSDVLLKLLKNCRSNKVKRIFLFLANYHDLPIFSKIKKHIMDIGKGVIQIIAKGKYNKEYSITVPSSFAEKENIF